VNCNSVINGVEIAGIYFNSLLGEVDSGTSGINLRGPCRQYKIHDNRFSGHARAGITAWGLGWGVIYSNQFHDNRDTSFNTGYGIEVIGEGAASWSRWPASPSALLPENEEFVYVEDNTFATSKHTTVCNNGARYVMRHNTITNMQQNGAHFDRHGLAAWDRGCRQSSVYDNTTSQAGSHFAVGNYRGGDGVHYNNTSTGGESRYIELENDRFGSNAQSNNCTYPCTDQIRRFFAWNNTLNGSNGTVVVRAGFGGLIQLNRDYFTSTPSGGEYTAFTYPHPLRGLSPPSVASSLLGGYIMRSDPSKIYLDLDDPNGGMSVGSATGFSCSIDATPTTITAASCASESAQFARCTLSISDAVTSGTQAFLCSYSQGTGNVVDGDAEELEAFTDAGMVNWYNKIFNPKNVLSTTGFDPGRGPETLFDDDSTNEASSMAVAGTAPVAMEVQFDLINAVELDSVSVIGDNQANYQCETYDFAHKTNVGDSYTTLFTGENCNTKTLLTKTFTATSDRYWRVIFRDNRAGASIGVQVFELNATPTAGGGEPPPEPPVLRRNGVVGSSFFGVSLTP